MISAKYSKKYNQIFDNIIEAYHRNDDIYAPCPSIYALGKLEQKLACKCWIDTVQWHLEDIIRDPDITPAEALQLKRRIDRSNQDRTDIVERIDDFFLDKFSSITPQPDARLNTESLAWAIDRLSILALKIYHMSEQPHRDDASEDHIAKCRAKLEVLLMQRDDLSQAIDELFDDIMHGRRIMKVYRQMKMYNDVATNPILYSRKNE